MKNKQILKQAIEKASKNGYSSEEELKTLFDVFGIDYTFCNFGAEPFYYTIIFSHYFAKAFWKDEETGIIQSGDNMVTRYFGGWQYHIQQMVLEKEPLKYLEKFL